MKGKVLIAAPVHPVLTEGLFEEGYECVVQEKITQEQAQELVRDCAGIITSTRLQLDEQLIDAAPRLQWIGRMGSGMELIDLEYAAKKGVRCFSSPEGNCNAVAEHAMGMLLSLNKKILKSSCEVREGKWLRNENRGTEIEGKTIGIIGYGHTGRAFVKKLSGFDAKILIYDKYNTEYEPLLGEKCTGLERIYEESDIISFHVPLQKDTMHYFDSGFINNMKKPFVLINTSRGVVVNTAHLYEGLLYGKVAGACLDVWEEEPISAMSMENRALLQKMAVMDSVIVTPHIAGYSVEALYKMSHILLGKIVSRK